MKTLKITIVGNSVALRTRPTLNHPANKNYSQLLEEILEEKMPSKPIYIKNIAVGATTVYDASINTDKIIHTFPRFFIINLGVVDSCSREVPLWFYRIATSKKDKFINNFAHLIYRGLIFRFRPFLVRLRAKKSWVSKKKFKKYYTKLVETLLKETNAQIIAIPINPVNDRIEKALPGSRKKNIAYNTIIKEIIDSKSQFFIDIGNLNSPIHYPDGVHYSFEGHKAIVEKLLKPILKNKL